MKAAKHYPYRPALATLEQWNFSLEVILQLQCAHLGGRGRSTVCGVGHEEKAKGNILENVRQLRQRQP